MKRISFFFAALAGVILFVIAFSCEPELVTHSKYSDGDNAKVEIRASLNELVFGDGISRTPHYNETNEEYEYTISSAFEIKPYNDNNWYQYTADKHIKIKCRCTQCPPYAGSECNEVLNGASPTVATCDNQCGSPYWSCTCKMKRRITSTSDDTTIAEYEGGANVELL